MIELGRIHIITKVLLLSSHVALPREEHVEAAVHVMAHVGQEYNSRLVYNPSYPKVDHIVFKDCDWSELYRNVMDKIPINSTEPGGNR